MCREGDADILMKGNVHTGVILRAILDRDSGIGQGGLLSNTAVFESPHERRLMFMADPAVNIAPDVTRKVEMIRNAVWVAHRLGFARPKVAVIAPIEVSVKDLPATTDAALIAKMGEAGQVADADIAGPMPLDVAVSRQAAKIKNVKGPVAGRADILLCPDLNSGNVLVQGPDPFRRPRSGQRDDRREDQDAPGDELPLGQRPDAALHDGPGRGAGGRRGEKLKIKNCKLTIANCKLQIDDRSDTRTLQFAICNFHFAINFAAARRARRSLRC